MIECPEKRRKKTADPIQQALRDHKAESLITKRCIGLCGEIKAIDNFSLHSKKTGIYRNKCKPCFKIENAQRYQKDREFRLSQAKKYQFEHKDKVNADRRKFREDNKELVRATEKKK